MTTEPTPTPELVALLASELVESYTGFMLTRGGFDEFWFSVDDDTRAEIIADLERNAANILSNTRAATVPQGVFSAEGVANLIAAAESMRRAVDDETAALETMRGLEGVDAARAAESRVTECSALLAEALAATTPPPAELGKGS